MSDAGLWRDDRTGDADPAEWDLWRLRAEKRLGYEVTDGDQVDALYSFYMQDMAPERSADILQKALSIALAADAAVRERRKVIFMREENEFDRFRPTGEAEHAISRDKRTWRSSKAVHILMWSVLAWLWLGLMVAAVVAVRHYGG